MMARGLYWISGFALCGAIKVAFDGDWTRVGMLLAVVALCELAAWDIRRLATGDTNVR
jgi:hypothetical protein|tara:strand:+ start:261 stop:434 length:174 start_codon:yes stop_codon:yes gene_type:complete